MNYEFLSIQKNSDANLHVMNLIIMFVLNRFQQSRAGQYTLDIAVLPFFFFVLKRITSENRTLFEINKTNI